MGGGYGRTLACHVFQMSGETNVKVAIIRRRETLSDLRSFVLSFGCTISHSYWRWGFRELCSLFIEILYTIYISLIEV